MSKRLEATEDGGKGELKVVNREVAQIYTKGTTYFKMDGSRDYDTKYVLAYY